MSCERYRDALTDLAAGGRPPAGLEAHLASCESCGRELDALRRALALAEAEMARLVRAEPSPGLASRIRQAADGPTAAPAFRLGWIWPVAAASATLAVAIAVWVARPAVPVRVGAPDGSSSPRAAVVPDAGATAVPPPTASVEAGRSEPPRSAPPVSRAPVSRREGSTADRPVGAARDDRFEVLVPPGEGEALLRLVALAHRAGRTPATLLAAGQPSADLAEPAPLDIEPLEIVPLDPAETSGTD